MKKLILAITALAAVSTLQAQKWEDLAKTPPMGWSSWNKFATDINENLIKEIADEMVASGLKDAGYVYLNLDDGWHGPRDEEGRMTVDSVKFPSGFNALSDYIHSKGLKFGVYSDAGCATCAGKPGSGSQGHEYQDARSYAQWGVDYLKYDWCWAENLNPVGAYTLMRDALRDAGRPILFSMCEWGRSEPWKWAKDIGHSWRISGDIHNGFDDYINHGAWETYGAMQIVDMNAPLRAYAGPGHWNDPDMLEVGNGMTENKDRATFTMWCMMASPLILGNDIRNMSKETKAILTNRDVIAIDQDSLGIQGLRVLRDRGVEYWVKPLVDGDWALCILNRDTEPRECLLDWPVLQVYDTVADRHLNFKVQTYDMRNLWTGKQDGTTEKNRTVKVPAQDVALWRLTPVKK